MLHTATPAPLNGGVEKTHLDELKAWVEEEKKNGLVDVKFYPADTSNSTVESFSGDVVAMLRGKREPVTDIA